MIGVDEFVDHELCTTAINDATHRVATMHEGMFTVVSRVLTSRRDIHV